MKLRSKAGVPIGTTAIIIIVLIAAIGMYWYFTQGGQDCSDVFHRDLTGKEKWGLEHYNLPYVIHWETSGLWQFYYSTNPDTNAFAVLDAYSLGQLEDEIKNSNIASLQKTRGYHIINCIQADCPDCMVG